MPWCFIKFSQLILKGYVWRSVWKICMWILGLKGLNHLHLNYRSPLSGPTSLRRSTTCENISLNGQGQICPLICARERGLSNHTRNEYDSVKKTEKWEKKKWRLHSHFKAQKRRKKVGNMSKIVETPMYFPFPRKCWDVIGKVRGYNNIKKGRGETKRKRDFLKCFKVFVWDCSY